MSLKTTLHSVFTLGAMAMSGLTYAQFNGVRSLFTMSTFLENPASAGSESCLNMRMGVRSQWVGFDGAPTSQFASLTGRVAGSNSHIHGMGGYVLNEEIGPWSHTQLKLAYASKVKLFNGGRLSAGVALGVSQYRFDVVLNGVASTLDEALNGQNASQTAFPSMDFGLWYEDSHNVAAFSIQNVVPTSLDQLANQSTVPRTYVLTGGKVVSLDRRFKFRPAAQVRLSSGLPAAIDLQGSFSLDNRWSMGLGYRNRSALIGVMSIKLFDSMTVGYAYDFGVSSIRSGATSSHEIVISLSSCDKADPFAGPNGRCPAFD